MDNIAQHHEIPSLAVYSLWWGKQAGSKNASDPILTEDPKNTIKDRSSTPCVGEMLVVNKKFTLQGRRGSALSGALA